MAILSRLSDRWSTPVSSASLRLLQVCFGLIMAGEMIRYLVFGWVQTYYVEPAYHFSYPGFSWLQPAGETAMVSLFVFVGLMALCMVWGIGRRWPAALFTLGFGSIFLMDQAYYQNHLYLVVLIGGLFTLNGLGRGESARLWMVDLMRLQVGVVYVFGGLAKLNADWLAGEPMTQWMSLRADWAVIGPIVGHPSAGLWMSILGMVFDLLIVPLLLWHRTRRWAFAGVVVFHTLNAVLFKIGVFPILMVALTTIFFAPSWCERSTREVVAGPKTPVWVRAICIAWVLTQVTVPMRSWAMVGHTSWTEEGHRFSWRMKLRSKVGRVVFHALDKERGTHKILKPDDELTTYQARRMATRPRMILQYARHLAESLSSEGSGRWAVHADARASLNGRPSQSLVDPTADLALPDADGEASWIVPLQR